MNKQEFINFSLSHELVCEILDYKSDYVGNQYDVIVGIQQWSKDGKLWSLRTAGGASPAFDRVKPVLRPLSDLTKAIEHIKYELNLNPESENYEYLGVVNYSPAFMLDGVQVGIMAMPFFFVQKLIEWKFDIAGLIEKGEAIDLNSLSENPYK